MTYFHLRDWSITMLLLGIRTDPTPRAEQHHPAQKSSNPATLLVFRVGEKAPQPSKHIYLKLDISGLIDLVSISGVVDQRFDAALVVACICKIVRQRLDAALVIARVREVVD